MRPREPQSAHPPRPVRPPLSAVHHIPPRRESRQSGCTYYPKFCYDARYANFVCPPRWHTLMHATLRRVALVPLCHSLGGGADVCLGVLRAFLCLLFLETKGELTDVASTSLVLVRGRVVVARLSCSPTWRQTTSIPLTSVTR